MQTVTDEQGFYGYTRAENVGVGAERFQWSQTEDSAGNLVVSFIDAVTGTISSYNTNVTAQADNNAAIAAYNQQILAVSAQNAALEAKAREKEQEMVMAALLVAALLVLGFVFVLFNRKKVK